MSALPPRQGLVAFLATLAGAQPAGWLELRHRRADGRMRQRFFDAAQPSAAGICATVLSQTGDVFVGCAPRRERAGGRDAIEHGWVLWVDCDEPQALAALERFQPRPAIVVRTSPRGVHAYWPLDRPLGVTELERANRRLAHALDADPACADAARILRPPATVNRKYEPPAPVTLECFTGERLSPIQITGRLPDLPPPRLRGPMTAGPSVDRRADPLLSIEPAAYVQRLTGRRVGRDGKAPCPFHRDETPSLHAYPDPAAGWACFSAKCLRGGRPNGGDIYDLAGQLWGLSTRGRDFLELRRRLRELLLPQLKAPAPRAARREVSEARVSTLDRQAG